MELLKVVWICHFSNGYIQKRLNVPNRVNEFAPWISLAIEEIKKRNDIELHIISPHKWISRDINFIDENIHYYFFNSGIPIYGRHWPRFFKFDSFTNYYFNTRKIVKIANNINPDLINLHGIENPYYSSSILKLKKYPVLVTIQGLNSLNSSLQNTTSEVNDRVKLEQKILREFNNFGIRVLFLEKYIKKINPSARFYWFKYPFDTKYSKQSIENKTYDCVFYARVSKEKGVEDLIEAIRLVKKHRKSISVKIIGGCNISYRTFLQQQIKNKGLENNIELLGFIPKHSDVHKIVASARITVLPTYNDILPGTIIESLKIGVPVIAYAANGVIDFNIKRETIQLVKLGNINELADSISYLLNHADKRDKLIKNGFITSNEDFNNYKEIDKMIDVYRRIINIK